MIAPHGPILAIDTAASDASLALEVDGRLIAEHRWHVESTVSRELLAAVDRVLAEAGVERSGLAALAVCAGPGGYNGLRAGIATAQGIALALDVPLAAVSRLEAEAASALAACEVARPIVAVHDTGRAGVAWAAYACPALGAPPEQLVAPAVTSVEECVARAPAGAVWCGELPPALAEARIAAGRRGDEDAPPPDRSRAAALLEVARKRDAYDDPAAADAIYLRPPPITKPTPR